MKLSITVGSYILSFERSSLPDSDKIVISVESSSEDKASVYEDVDDLLQGIKLITGGQ